MEQYNDQIKIESTNIFPKPPIIDLLVESVEPTTSNSNSEGNYKEITNISIYN